MRISSRLRAVIIAAIDEAGGVSEFARRVGLSPATVSRYRGGQIKSFSTEAWIKVKPVIESYANLTEDPISDSSSNTGLTVDQQILLKKYSRLTDDQKIRLSDVIDQLLHEDPHPVKIQFKAAEAPGNYNS